MAAAMALQPHDEHDGDEHGARNLRRACEVAPYLRRLVQDALLADALGS